MNRVDSNILRFIIYGVVYDLVINLYKPFSLKFLDRMSGSELHFSLMNSLPGLFAVFALLPGSMFISKFRSKRNLTSILFLASRTFILFFILVPYFPVTIRAGLFVLLYSLMNFPDAISQCALQNFLGESFNGFTRAKAISLRNKFGNIMVPVVTMVTGLIITFVPTSDSMRITIYQIFFGLSFLAGLFEIGVFRSFKEKLPEKAEFEKNKADEEGFLAKIRTVLKDKEFVTFLVVILAFQFTWQAAWPLNSIYQIKILGADEIWLALFALSAGVASFFSAGWWAKLISKKGNNVTLIVAAFGLACNMYIFALCPNLTVMFFANAFAGAVTIGINIGLLNALLNVTHNENRMVYIGVYNTFVNISLSISPLFAHLLLQVFGLMASMYIMGTLRLVSGFLIFMAYRKKPSA